MATTTKKYRIEQKLANGDNLILHPETDASVVKYSNNSQTTVGGALDDLYTKSAQITQSDWNQTDETKGDYIKNKPTIPTVNNGKLTIKYTINSGTQQTKEFTANQSGNLEVDLGNIISSHQSLTSYQTKAISLTGITATTVEGALTEINDLAKGKNKSYVTNTTQMAALNTQDAAVTVTSFKDASGTTIALTNFKVGDNVFITNTDVPDRWVSAVSSSSMTLSKLETQKVTVPTKTSELTNDSNFVSDSNYKHITVSASDGVSDGTNTYKYVLTKAAIDALISYQAPINASNKLNADYLSDGTTNKPSVWNGKYTKPSTGIPSTDLADSTVSAGTYSVVAVNAKGLVTSGGQIAEVGTVKDAGPSDSLVIGGLFFRLLEA